VLVTQSSVSVSHSSELVPLLCRAVSLGIRLVARLCHSHALTRRILAIRGCPLVRGCVQAMASGLLGRSLVLVGSRLVAIAERLVGVAISLIGVAERLVCIAQRQVAIVHVGFGAARYYVGGLSV
jgi:hypothetical protein